MRSQFRNNKIRHAQIYVGRCRDVLLSGICYENTVELLNNRYKYIYLLYIRQMANVSVTAFQEKRINKINLRSHVTPQLSMI